MVRIVRLYVQIKAKTLCELDFDVYRKEVTFSGFDETESLICEESTVIVNSSRDY